ncbi:MAG TPA: TIGR00725 family protein [Ardenticatenaceae bacterium]
MTASSRPLRVAVVGAGQCDEETAAKAEAVGRTIAEAGAWLVCGGGGGVMEAASRGAREAGGRTIGLLPGEDLGAANPWIEVAIATGLGEARNLLVVRNADAVIAVGGEWGTLSEIALARKIGRPVVLLGSWSLTDPQGRPAELPAVDSAEEAVRQALAATRLGEQAEPDL